VDCFLTELPPDNQIVSAIRRVKRSWGLAWTEDLGGTINRRNGATWILTPSKYAAIFSPRWAKASAPRELKRIIDHYRENQVQRMICGWIGASSPRNLPDLLAEEGFEKFHEYTPMWLDLKDLTDLSKPPAELDITCQDAESFELDKYLPYFEPDEVVGKSRLFSKRPRKAWYFAARLRDEVVGHITLFITRGKSGIAGIYDLGVIESARGQGIGTALTVVACKQAQSLGVRYVTLDPSPDGLPVYRKVGFKEVTSGQTWRLFFT
jgi:GNAT superfamily N-acetyltransferase